MMLTKKQARIIANIAEDSPDGNVHLDHQADWSEFAPVARKPLSDQENGVNDQGWKRFDIYPGGRTLVPS